MITDSFDVDSGTIISLGDLYGEQKNLIEKCLIIFSKEIYKYLLSNK